MIRVARFGGVGCEQPNKCVQGEFKMRIWLLLMLFACLASALLLGFGSPAYGEKSAEIVATLESL
jgi:hypothetical protein